MTQGKGLTLHDLRTAVQTVRLLIHEIESGYKFDDESAPKILNQLKRSADVLDRHVALTHHSHGMLIIPEEERAYPRTP